MLNEKLKIPSLRELIKITFNRRKWSSKTPYKKWCYLYGIGRAFFSTIGIKAYQDDQSLSWIAFIPFVSTAAYTILAIYTVIYFVSHGEPFKCLPCTCLLVGPVYCVRLTNDCANYNAHSHIIQCSFTSF